MLELKGKHWIVRGINLFDKTDYHDCFVADRAMYMHRDNLPSVPGRIFFCEDPQTGDAKVLIVEAPDYVQPSLSIRKNVVHIKSEGYPVTVLECRRGECEAVCRKWYREKSNRKTLITMSNTWGDMNSRDRVYQAFVRKEVDTAAELGLDVVQVDDGWQTLFPTGAIRDEKGRRYFYDPMWELSEVRFPDGMKNLRDYGAERGVSLGLWFAPDSSNGFERLDRDISVLKKAYDEWGFCYFKLDMLSIQDKESYDRFLSMLEAIRALGPDAEVQLDVTNEVRLGFLTGIEYGTLFVENRYTKTTTYYPHRTLRNLWYLSRYLPTCRFQFEIVNPDLAPEAYGDDDFAPVHCDLDYLFASVMVSNPLFWMEVQFLTEERRAQLNRIFPLWRSLREELAAADVTPIGEIPDARSMTGFCGVKGEDVYLVLLREVTHRETFCYDLPVSVTDLEVLATNADGTVTADGTRVTASFSKERGYSFVKGKIR